MADTTRVPAPCRRGAMVLVLCVMMWGCASAIRLTEEDTFVLEGQGMIMVNHFLPSVEDTSSGDVLLNYNIELEQSACDPEAGRLCQTAQHSLDIYLLDSVNYIKLQGCVLKWTQQNVFDEDCFFGVQYIVDASAQDVRKKVLTNYAADRTTEWYLVVTLLASGPQAVNFGVIDAEIGAAAAFEENGALFVTVPSNKGEVMATFAARDGNSVRFSLEVSVLTCVPALASNDECTVDIFVMTQANYLRYLAHDVETQVIEHLSNRGVSTFVLSKEVLEPEDGEGEGTWYVVADNKAFIGDAQAFTGEVNVRYALEWREFNKGSEFFANVLVVIVFLISTVLALVLLYYGLIHTKPDPLAEKRRKEEEAAEDAVPEADTIGLDDL